MKKGTKFHSILKYNKNCPPPPEQRHGYFSCLKTSFSKLIFTRTIEPERGRSMTEMLGVLAIIGVLSIGSITGYRFAMAKHKANETLNEVEKMAVLFSNQLMQSDTITQSEYGEKTRLGYNIATDVVLENGYFMIEIYGLEPSVCEQMLKADYQTPIRIDKDGTMYKDDTYEGNPKVCYEYPEAAVEYRFSLDLNKNENDDDAPKECGDGNCYGGGICVNRSCMCYPTFSGTNCENDDAAECSRCGGTWMHGGCSVQRDCSEAGGSFDMSTCECHF